MDPVSPRQAEILDRARRTGRVDVDSLADEFSVTPQTIRKDLNDLCERGMLQRVHGGAVLPSGIANYAYDARRQIASDEKRLIGDRTAALVPDNASIMLNIGTTTEQVARALRQHDGIMAITNNINVANILRTAPAVEVIIAGGQVRASDGGIVGEATVDFIRQFKVDYAVIGASAIDTDGTIFDYDFREVRVSREILSHARQVLLVADSMKFQRSAPVRIAHISEIDIFVTDKAPPASVVEICREHGVRIEIAGQDEEDAPAETNLNGDLAQ
ncbi:MAG: DeoR family transcriptional regulator [Stappia sp.]|uniref:DeoR/GlpR family DNA-binding transcription regulator n=1 Tax=Stappia sp. TaxID=1870903 RepID=UPI000C4AF4B6|nr:DeoR/GlpR family DNA-binding transcription regulator [Stappia sp.]MAA97279.1 DeoR family transcriptional regulator [Stappia sp.]MBM18564.1 DeoR family transcriptional regulator [Stappia sp.]